MNEPRPLSGVFTLAEALAAGWSRSAVRRRLVAGHWRCLARGVYIAGDAPATPWQQARAIHLATGGVASHTTAARVYFMWTLDPVDWVTVPANMHRAPRPGLRLHRSDMPGTDVDRISGVPVTTPIRTIADLARRYPLSHAVCALDSGLRNGRLTSADLNRLSMLPSPQIRGAAELADPRSESPLETCVRLLLMAARIRVVPQWEVASGGRRFRLDLAVPECRVGIECDGTTVHGGPQALYGDRQRSNQLVQAGWVLLRFTWWDVRKRPAWIVETVSAAVASRRLGSRRG